MKELLAFISPQTPPQSSGEGLPYWIFWFLICIIVLLLFFIFLRDKNLRRRINLFFFGAKQKLIKMRLQLRLKRESKRKLEIFQELGQKAWQESRDIPDSDKITSKLSRLDNEEKTYIQELMAAEAKIIELNEIFKAAEQDLKDKLAEQEAYKKPKTEQLRKTEENESALTNDIHLKKKEMKSMEKAAKSSEKEIQHLQKDQKVPEEDRKAKIQTAGQRIKDLSKDSKQTATDIEEAREVSRKLGREIKSLKEEIEVFDKKIHSIKEEEKTKRHEFRKEIKEWESKRDKTQEKIREIKKNREPLYETLGKLANKSRIDDDELILYYNRIDKSGKRIEELEKQIGNLE